MKLRKAFITGVSSTSLKEEEISFLKKYKSEQKKISPDEFTELLEKKLL